MTKAAERVEEVSCSVERIDPVHVRMKVVVPATEVDAAIRQQFARIAQTARIPGFRRGRAPRELLERHFWPIVRAEVQKQLVGESFSRLVSSQEFRPTGSFEIEQISLTPGEPLSYCAAVEVFPEVGAINYIGLQVEAPIVEVTDSQVEDALTRLQERYAKLKPVEEPRGVQLGDVVEVTLEPVAGGRSRGASRRELIWLQESDDESAFAPLIGKKVGEQAEVSLQVSSGGTRLSRDGSMVQPWRARVEAIYERLVPNLDDDFARTVSNSAETLEELKAQVREDLTRRLEARRESLLRNRLRSALVEANPQVAVPPSLVKQETGVLAESYFSSLRLPIDRVEEFLERNPSIAEALAKEAKVRVASEILLVALAEQENIEVNESEVDELIKQWAEQESVNRDRVLAHYSRAEERERLRRELIVQRALDLVRQRAQVRDVVGDKQIADAAGNG